MTAIQRNALLVPDDAMLVAMVTKVLHVQWGNAALESVNQIGWQTLSFMTF